MTPSEFHPSAQPFEPAGVGWPPLGVLAIDFIDVNRTLTLASQLVQLARIWNHQTGPTDDEPFSLDRVDGLSSLGAVASEIDRLLLDLQYLLPRLFEIVDRYAVHLEHRPTQPTGAASGQGIAILIDGSPIRLEPRAAREYNGDIAVAAADVAARAVVEAEARRRQLWQEFGRIAQGSAPIALWPNIGADVTVAFGISASIPEWLADAAQMTIAWLSGQLGVRARRL